MFFGVAMKRTLFFCLLSAAMGALAAATWNQSVIRHTATAQEPMLRQPAVTPGLPPSASSRRLPGPADVRSSSNFGSGLEEFAPEERTNILVYEKANRSVVHIKTNSAQRELFFL